MVPPLGTGGAHKGALSAQGLRGRRGRRGADADGQGGNVRRLTLWFFKFSGDKLSRGQLPAAAFLSAKRTYREEGRVPAVISQPRRDAKSTAISRRTVPTPAKFQLDALGSMAAYSSRSMM